MKQAAKITVIEAIRQSNNAVSRKKFRDGKIVSLVFGIYGSLAAKNIKRNPKRFRAITGSIFLSVVIALSLYSFSDFMLYQTSLDMKEDGSCYTDVISMIQYKDIPVAIGALSDENITADVSYSFQRYMTAEFSQEQINPDMQGYFINGTKAEVYVVGLDEEHFVSFCDENGFSLDVTNFNHGILLNQTMGYYNSAQNRVIAGSPFLIEPGTEIIPLGASEDALPIIVEEIVSEENANIQSMFVRDRAVLIVPLSYFTFQENGELAVSKDMPDSGLSCGDAYYSFSYSDIICVTQGNSSVEFEIEVDQNELKIFFMGQEYLELEK